MPAIWPCSLIPVAAPEVSPATKGSAAMSLGYFVNDRQKLQLLRRDAGWIVNIGLRPTDDLATAVCACGKTIVTAESWQRAHSSIFPSEPEIDEACAGSAGIKRGAAPSFPQRVRH